MNEKTQKETIYILTYKSKVRSYVIIFGSDEPITTVKRYIHSHKYKDIHVNRYFNRTRSIKDGSVLYMMYCFPNHNKGFWVEGVDWIPTVRGKFLLKKFEDKLLDSIAALITDQNLTMEQANNNVCKILSKYRFKEEMSQRNIK